MYLYNNNMVYIILYFNDALQVILSSLPASQIHSWFYVKDIEKSLMEIQIFLDQMDFIVEFKNLPLHDSV